MAHTLEAFASQCHDILSKTPGPAGREQVKDLLQDVLKDSGFVEKYLGPDNDSQRKIIYEDPDLGFCILAHVYSDAKNSDPHDHGPSWAIYGQAAGVTEMSDFQKLTPPTEGKPGTVKATTQYELRPGMARVYNEGDLHAPTRRGPTRLIRLEGRNMEKVTRDKYVLAS